ncbi:MAG: hypothetical protein ACI8W3_003411 [Myxococcota bacterium]|jgi:hypothetical protein
MIRVVHNAVDQALDCADCENLEDVLERCRRSSDDEPHLFTNIRLDGLDVPEDSFEQLEQISIEGIEKIELESRPTLEIALSSLRHSSAYVIAIRQAAGRVVELFRTGRSDEANDLLAHLSDSLGVLVAAVSGITRAVPTAAPNLLGPVNELTEWLDKVLEGQANGDWVFVADILEYEVDSRLEDWARAMDQVLAELT